MNNNKDIKALKNIDEVFKSLISKKTIDNKLLAIEVKNLSFSIKKRLLLNKVSFDVLPGRIHGFLGPNGAGKTTTIKNIIDAYVTRDKESSINICGFKSNSEDAKRKIAYIPEYASFPKHLNLFSYLETMARFSGIEKKEANKKANELLNVLGLTNFKTNNPNDFSSGMKKKVLLAQSLMTDPEVLILDEPAANLDPTARDMLFKSLKNISDAGVAILISSHILSELEGLVEDITLINSGNVVYSGSVESIANNLKDKSHSIKIYADNYELLITESNKLKIKFIKDIRYIKFTSENKKELYKLIDLVAKDKVEVSKIEFDAVSLQEIYNKEFVK